MSQISHKHIFRKIEIPELNILVFLAIVNKNYEKQPPPVSIFASHQLILFCLVVSNFNLNRKQTFCYLTQKTIISIARPASAARILWRDSERHLLTERHYVCFQSFLENDRFY